jgi:hypothetical protein
MKRKLIRIAQVLIISLSLMAFTGCIQLLGVMGSGAAMTAEYVMNGAVSKTISYEYSRIRKAVLVALCNMEFLVDTASEIEGGEQITASAEALELNIKITEITPSVTRISVVAEKSLLSRDKATAREVVQQTTEVAGKLVS